MNLLENLKKDLMKGKKINIVFIGDSITSTEWVHPNWREIIEYVLKEELTKIIKDWKIPSWNIRCFNCGFDGSTTDDILQLMDKEILSLNPTIAIYMANTNDLHYDKSLPAYKKHVEQIIKKLLKKCSNVIVANSIPGNNEKYNKEYSKYAYAIKTIKFGEKTTFVNMYDKYLKLNLKKFFTFKSVGNDVLKIKPGELDFVHPNQLGNAYIAKIILENAFRISFNPEKFIKDTLEGKMYPGY